MKGSDESMVIFRGGTVESVVEQFNLFFSNGAHKTCVDWQIMEDKNRHAPVILVARILQDTYDDFELTEQLMEAALEEA